MKRRIFAFRLGCTTKVYHNWASYMRGETDSQHLRVWRGGAGRGECAVGTLRDSLRLESVALRPRRQAWGPFATVWRLKVSHCVHTAAPVDPLRQFAGRKCRIASPSAGLGTLCDSLGPNCRNASTRSFSPVYEKSPAKAGPCVPRRTCGPYWMRVRQYGQTFQSALSGRWQVGQTLRTCVLQIGQTTKSRSMGAPHLGQMP